MKKIFMKKIFIIIGLIIALVIGGFVSHIFDNAVDYGHQKIDEATKYENLKEVEDTCRTMIASYESDRLTYEQYRDSDNAEKLEWAEQAKMRANKTAATYNNYILKNSYLWKNNVPDDIYEELEVLK